MDYPETLSVQVEAVIYHNDIPSLLSAIAAMANAARVYRKKTGKELKLHMIYGDSSSEPLFDQQMIQSIQETYAEFLSFSYRFFGFNSGTSKGLNLMAKGFDGDFYVIMNPDVKVVPTFLVRMIAPFLNDETVGVTEARQTPMEHQKVYDEKTLETDWSTGACYVIRKKAFDSVNGYDEKSFFLYCDDVDLSWRLRLKGWKLLYQPSVPVYHAKTLTVDGRWKPTDAEVYYSAYAHMLMAYKWSNPSRLKKLQQIYGASEDPRHQKALADFKALSADQLPEQLDRNHKVARFVGDYYSENRYIL